MAVPPAVAAGAAKLLANEAVRRAATAGARRLAASVWAGVFSAKEEAGTAAPAPAPDLSALVADLPTREEMAAAFAVLQADLDRRHKLTLAVVAAAAVVQTLLLVWIATQVS